MMDIEATLELVRQRHRELCLLAGPQPLFPWPVCPIQALHRALDRMTLRHQHTQAHTASQPTMHDHRHSVPVCIELLNKQ